MSSLVVVESSFGVHLSPQLVWIHAGPHILNTNLRIVQSDQTLYVSVAAKFCNFSFPIPGPIHPDNERPGGVVVGDWAEEGGVYYMSICGRGQHIVCAFGQEMSSFLN